MILRLRDSLHSSRSDDCRVSCSHLVHRDGHGRGRARIYSAVWVLMEDVPLASLVPESLIRNRIRRCSIDKL